MKNFHFQVREAEYDSPETARDSFWGINQGQGCVCAWVYLTSKADSFR